MSDPADNSISDLREQLFATIRALRDKADPMDVQRAKAIAEVAGRIIDSARAETEFVKAFGGRGSAPASGFIAARPKPDTLDQQDGGAKAPPRLPAPPPARETAPEQGPGRKHSMPPRAPMGTL